MLLIFTSVNKTHSYYHYFLSYGLVKGDTEWLVISSIQVIILSVIPRVSGVRTLNAKNLLMFIVLFQYLPRLVRIVPLYREVTRTSGIITQTAWAGAAFNLILYMLASHVSVDISPTFYFTIVANCILLLFFVRKLLPPDF